MWTGDNGEKSTDQDYGGVKLLSKRKRAPMESCDPIEVFDQPEVQHVLFYPVRLPDAGRDDPRNLFFEVEPGIQIGCRFYKIQESSPTVLFFHHLE